VIDGKEDGDAASGPQRGAEAVTAALRAARRYGQSRLMQLQLRRRYATAHARALPGLLVIGAQKSGTSSLYSYLAQHPQLYPSWKKEVNFFVGGPGTDHDCTDALWYRAHFPLARRLGDATAFEASPRYLFHPLAASRIHELLPHARLVAVLRNPTERALSHYFHACRHGAESLPIAEAFEREESRLQAALDAQRWDDPAFILNAYKRRGLYRQQLERFCQHFPREQLCVVSSDALFSDPASTLRRIFAFAGVDPSVRVPDVRPRNVGRRTEPLSDEVRQQLDAFFRPHNSALFEWLGESWDW
jgi:hypothetical protein